MSEINNDNIGLDSQLDTTGEGEKRSEKRYKDLADKVSNLAREKEELTKAHEAEKAEMAKKTAEAEFKANFAELVSKYPDSKEFEADIKAKVNAGYTPEDAAVSTLASKGKLVSPEAQKQEIRSESMGGSVDTNIKEIKRDDPSFGGDVSKMREELLNLEKKGEIGLRL